MRYYKVTKTRTVFTGSKRYRTMIENELITEKEWDRQYKGLSLERNVAKGYLEPVNISSHKVYWMMGCRFECKEVYISYD